MANIAKGGLPDGFVVVRKYGNTPADVEQSMADQGMGVSSTGMWGPGRPLNPAWGYGGQPRKIDFQPGHNITNRPLRDGRISFDALKQLTSTWDMAQICITRRINDIRSLGWSIKAADGVGEDVSTAIAYATQKVKYPEGPGSRLKYNAWVAKFLQSVLRYDAGCLYRRRDRADRVCGLSVVPGATMAPLLDTWGGTPTGPAPAFTQWIRGQAVKQFTVDEIIYEPFMPLDDSPYGVAPMEAVILSANTDLRQQAFLLSHFTAGTVPEGFATLPSDISTPDQIADFQAAYDATMYGDTDKKHALTFVPFGTNFEWPKDRTFDKDLAMWMAGKCAAAYGQTMNDLGFTEDVNRATGDTQVDVQFRVGSLPYVLYVQGIITAYLQDDLGLPVEFLIDTGQEKDDRLQSAQVDKIDIEAGVVSPDEVRERRGLAIDNERPTPRFVMHSRRGPIPLLDIVSAGGKVDGETYGPAQDQPLLADPSSVAAVVPEERTAGAQALLAQDDKTQAAARATLHPGVPPLPPVGTSTMAGKVVMHPTPEPAQKALERVLKDLTAGITAATGFTGNPLEAGRPKRKDDEDGPVDLVVKAATVGGLAVKAADTGRVLMLQRAIDGDLTCPTCRAVGEDADGHECDSCDGSGRMEPDPAAGTWEFPGGHLEDGEDALTGACREWAEEVGAPVPPGQPGGTWTTANGVYTGTVWVVPSEETVTINPGPERSVLNPDDPDGDCPEVAAWWDPNALAGMGEGLRSELILSKEEWLPVVIGASMREATQVRKDLRQWRNVARRRVVQSGGTPPGQFVSGVIPTAVHKMVSGRLDGARTREDVDSAFRVIVKARGQGKGRWRNGAPDVPQRRYDLLITDHYADPIRRAMSRLWPRAALRSAVEAQTLAGLPAADAAPLRAVMEKLWADAWATGVHGAVEQVARVRKDSDGPGLPTAETVVDWSTWEPGNLSAAILASDGGLAAVLDQADVSIQGVTGTALDRLGDALSEGMLNGDSVDTITRSLAGIIDDPDRAEMIAQTESARLQLDASVQQYISDGVGAWDWLTTSGACPRCVDREAANPHDINDDHSPMHPYERCAVAPVWQSIE